MAPTLRFASRARPDAAASPRPAAVTTPPKTAAPPPNINDTASLAFRTRMRRGSWVNVVMMLRWLHSPVNIRIATTGRRITRDGGNLEVARVGLIEPRRGEDRHQHHPDGRQRQESEEPAAARVSVAWPTRPARAVRTGSVLGPTVPRRCRGFRGRVTWSCCSLLGRSRLRGGEREEQLFQPVCLGLAQLGQQHLVVVGDARHHLGRDPTTGDVHGEHISGPAM